MQRAAQEQRHHRGDRADHERDAPAPGFQFGLVQQLLQDHHHQHRQQLAADQRYVLERREEAAAAAQRHFAHVGGGGAILAAHRQALHQPREQQQRGRPVADAVIGGQRGDQQRAGAHHDHRDQHRVLAAVAVGDGAEQPAADGPHQEAGGKHAGGVQQLRGGIGPGKERRREIDGAERIDVEVEPFDQVARRRGDDGVDALAHLFAARAAGLGGSCSEIGHVVVLQSGRVRSSRGSGRDRSAAAQGPRQDHAGEGRRGSRTLAWGTRGRPGGKPVGRGRELARTAAHWPAKRSALAGSCPPLDCAAPQHAVTAGTVPSGFAGDCPASGTVCPALWPPGTAFQALHRLHRTRLWAMMRSTPSTGPTRPRLPCTA
ncbi:hypothetical protein D9M72_399700 [compost metagenome]